MSFDPKAAAIDWLDAYGAGDLDTTLAMYAAIINCGCDVMKTITRPEGIRLYWMDRLRAYPASDLDNLQPSGDGILIS
ncbi:MULTISPECIES: nuclear transport factor 2 family protein [Bradyrhizobium]|uniref:nuclear transport factor 2 family protein n=1 Tax=Bradyrhizobium elkanii TaxID=29448 RepID=UPI000417F7C8|nr:nuclear transport factor 2 family protein [Bradyrhizobium elkanii]